MDEEAEETADPKHEAVRVKHRRLREAQRAGMSLCEARLFAESDIDIGELRRRLEQGVPPEWLAKIVL